MQKDEDITIKDMRRKNEEEGYYFFSEKTMRHFKCYVFDETYVVGDGRILFITRESDGQGGKRWRTNIYESATGHVQTPKAETFKSLREARNSARSRAASYASEA